MSERFLAHFLHWLGAQHGTERENGHGLSTTGAVADPAVLEHLLAQPAPMLHTLLSAHTDALLATWPGGATHRPDTIPSSALWVGAALNNLVWAATHHPSPRLFTITLRMVQALPVADTPDAALAYHSLLRHLEHLPRPPGDDWQPVVNGLVRCSPLTAAWLPQMDRMDRMDRTNAGASPWAVLLALLRVTAVWAALRDRWLALLPLPDTVARQGIPTHLAKANAALGGVLRGLRDHGGPDGQHLLFTFYEMDCVLQRRGTPERPFWPLLDWLHVSLVSNDELVARNARQVLARYHPLAPLLVDERLSRPYRQLDGRFLVSLADMLPADREKRVRLRQVLHRTNVKGDET